jgi:tripartite-type tricarboxylate transporter receptor subunit TctC
MIAAGDAIVPALRLKMPYDMERDLAPIMKVTSSPSVLVVHPSVPVRNVQELIALAKSQPGKLNYSSSGTGSTLYLLGELFNMLAGIKTVHVPYGGSAEATLAVAKGEADMSFPSVAGAFAFLSSEKVRALALTNLQRSPLLPSVPTLNESGVPGFDRGTWYGFLAPAGVPRDIIARLNDLTVRAINAPDVKDMLAKQGLEPLNNTPEQFTAMLHREMAENADLIKRSGLKPQ